MFRDNHFRTLQLVCIVFLLTCTVSIHAQEKSSKKDDKQPGEKIWTQDIGYAIYSSPAVVDGVVFVGERSGGLYAIEAESGKILWKKKERFSVETSPAAAKGDLFVGIDKTKLYSFDQDTGQKNWEFTISGNVLSSPAVAEENVFFAVRDKVYALNINTGAVVWQHDTFPYIRSSPAVSGERLFISGRDQLFALKTDTGKKVWESRIGDHFSSPAVSDALVLVGGGRSLHAFNVKTGERVWAFGTGGEIISSPSISEGRVFVGSLDQKVYALNLKTGKKIWEFKTGGSVRSSPAVTGDQVFIGSYDSKIYALDASNGEKLWDYQTGGDIFSSPAVVNGRLFVGSYDGNLYSIRKKKSEVFWPMFGQNAQRTSVTPPSITEQMKRDLKKIQSLISKNKLDRSRKMIRSWKSNDHPIARFSLLFIRIARKARNGKGEEAISIWEERNKSIFYHYQNNVLFSLLDAFHEGNALRGYFKELSSKLNSDSLEDRRQATKTFQNAGILALPVLIKLKDRDQLSVRYRAEMLLQKLKREWPSYFEE